MKILAVGDMHLGRTPPRLPPDLPPRKLGPAEAWCRAVDAALEAGAAAVVLAGDVVDRDDDFFEAYRELERGVGRLADAGVSVIGVAGNHDVEVLPRLARHIARFRLLGAGGQWESCSIEDGTERITLWGWSFPQAKVYSSPLRSQAFELPPGLNLGLLHCDRDAGPDSPYAPVSAREIEGAGLDGWLLGHLHRPDALSAPSPNGYLGSLSGLDIGEPGPRGPWMLTLSGARIADVVHLPLAPLRWESLEVGLAGIENSDDARERLLEAVIAFDARLAPLPAAPDAVGLSVLFTGRTAFGNAALDAISEEDRNAVCTGAAGTRYFVHRLRSDTRPEIALEELARRRDPAGLLAARLLCLEGPEDDPERERLLGLARQRLRAESAKSVWRGLEAGAREPDPAAWLRRAGYRSLDRLLDQASGPPSAG